MQRAIFFEEERCIGCDACIVACKLEHHLPPHPMRPPLAAPLGPEPIHVLEVWPEAWDDTARPHFRPIACLHCPEAACIPACPLSAIYRDLETGVILVHEEECTNCRLCLEACPYGSPQFFEGRMYLCNLCVHRRREQRAKGRETACEAACPAKAIHVGPPDEIAALAVNRSAERVRKEQTGARRM